MEKAVNGAKEGATEALTAPIKTHVNLVCNETNKNNQNMEQEGSIPEWVTPSIGLQFHKLVGRTLALWAISKIL